MFSLKTSDSSHSLDAEYLPSDLRTRRIPGQSLSGLMLFWGSDKHVGLCHDNCLILEF